MTPVGLDLSAAVLAACPTPAAAVDAEGRLVWMSDAALRFLGYPSCPEADGATLYHRRADAGLVRDRVAARDTSTPAWADPIDVVFRLRSGAAAPVRVYAWTARGAEGGVGHTYAFFEDRREAVDLARRLEEATAQVLSTERRALDPAALADLAHVLSQPLTAAMGHVELVLLSGGHDAETTTRLQKTYEQLNQAWRRFEQWTRSHRGSVEGG